MSFLGEIGDILVSKQGSKEQSVEWKIGNLMLLSGKHRDFYRSPVFDFSNASWRLEMFLNGDLCDGPSSFLDFYLKRMDNGPPLIIQFAMTIDIEGAGGLVLTKPLTRKFSKDCSPACGYENCLPANTLIEHVSIYMPNRTLDIICKMENVPSPSGESASNQMDKELKAKSLTSEKQRTEKVLEDFGKLLVSGENSDVTVQVGDTEFKVHRAILSARCPVLSAMFQHQTAEKASNKIIIKDCEPDIFRDFLQYLYTGTVKFLTEQNVFGVYRIGDKYLAEDLKSECLNHIRKTLCVQTFCDAVKLALTHGEDDLLQQAIDFAIGNIQQIICSVEWQNFLREYPTEANEILIKCLVPRS